MSVIKEDMKLPAPPPTGMAARYEQAYNEVVSEQSDYKRKIITENFEIVSGHMVYPDRRDQEMVHEVMKEVIRRAEKKG
jgi:uncharacterized protein YktB (UPF0637 family)